MATSNVYAVKYRRKREGKTNYKTRMKLLLGHKPRLTVRKSLKNIYMQLIWFEPKGDKVKFSASTKELAKYGWNAKVSNTSAAYLVGFLLAKKAKSAECVLDIGLYTSVKGSILYAAAKGAIDGGLKLACSEKVFPSEKRIRGEHVAEYAKQLKSEKEKYEKQFGNYIKSKVDPEKLPEEFDKVKAKIGAQ